jgi:hypothetical protein
MNPRATAVNRSTPRTKKMKKRTKITLRTKIYLTIAGLLGLTGVFYASNPTPFVFTIPFPTGVAAAPDLLLVSEFCSDNIDKVACDGTFSLFATLPGFGSCREKYITIAPSQSVNSGNPPGSAPFSPRDVFVTEGPNVYKISGGTVSLFTTLGGCLSSDHNGITFDHFGTFGFDMIVTCQEGSVFRVDGNGNATQIASIFPPGDGEVEGPAVVPPLFGPHGGEIWVADEMNGQVHAIGPPPTYTVTQNILSHVAAEGVFVIPSPQCTFCSGGAFFQAIQQGGAGQFVWQYPLSDFAGLGGNVILTSESGVEGADTTLMTTDGTNYFKNSFAPRIPGLNEGSSFVDCDVPTPTPTPTPTATFTPTPTATATATFTPTATATFTPTATATFTPTATATFTPTATATFTPTPTATFTPTPTPTASVSCSPLASCTPPYPFVSGNPRTNIAFNESEVLRAFRAVVDAACQGQPGTLQMFYNDEHAMTLGVRRVQTTTCAGTTGTDYPVSMMVGNPSSAIPPIIGATEAQGGVDTSGRPMYPVLYVTDLSVPPGSTNELAGDWQFGGTGIPPDAVFGTWKAAVRTVDKTNNTVTVTPDADPAKNNWNLGPGSDPIPTPTPTNEGYGAECRWNLASLNLIPSHRYRFYFMVHDGDQNKTGGDVGQACVYFTMPGPEPTATPTPTPTPSATATATPGTIVAGGQTFSGKTVVVKFQNDTAVSQVLTGLSITWPQGTNGNLKTIKMGGTTIFNTSTGGGTLTIPPPPLLGTTAQRTIAAGSCGTLTFTFQNNVSTNPADYTGSATFNPFGNVTTLP